MITNRFNRYRQNNIAATANNNPPLLENLLFINILYVKVFCVFHLGALSASSGSYFIIPETYLHQEFTTREIGIYIFYLLGFSLAEIFKSDRAIFFRPQLTKLS